MLESILRPDREKIMSLFPNIRLNPGCGDGPTVRPVLKVQEARKLLELLTLVFDTVPENFFSNPPEAGLP